MNTQVKTSYEKYPIVFNFLNNLKIYGETVTGKAVSCVDTSTGASSKSTIVVSESISSPKITLVVDSGTTNTTHKITVTAITSGGNSYTKYLLLVISNNHIDKFYKTPTSQFLISNDFEDDLESGDTLLLSVITAQNTSNGVDATSSVIESWSIEGSKVLVGVMGGSVGIDYRIAIKVTTNLGYKYQKDVLMRVRNEAQI